jgi:hypothetical protein
MIVFLNVYSLRFILNQSNALRNPLNILAVVALGVIDLLTLYFTVRKWYESGEEMEEAVGHSKRRARGVVGGVRHAAAEAVDVLYWERRGIKAFIRRRTAVGRCRLIVSKPVLKARLVSTLETKYDEPRSKFAFNFNLRRYTAAKVTVLVRPARYCSPDMARHVIRCHLTQERTWQIFPATS